MSEAVPNHRIPDYKVLCKEMLQILKTSDWQFAGDDEEKVENWCVRAEFGKIGITHDPAFPESKAGSISLVQQLTNARSRIAELEAKVEALARAS